ncbi:MAG: SCP2 sterol-binding domain-containing protein [Pseudomonadota bacterium]
MSTHDLVRQLINGMPRRLDKEAAKGLDTILQFELSGDAGGAFAIMIKDQTCWVEETLSADADATMKMSADTYIDLAFGRITGPQMFYKRKLRFDGSLNLIMKIHKLFPSLSKDEYSLD